MIPFRQFTGLVAPLDRANVDTDQIIPKQFLKRVERSGFGEFLFFDWRYTDDGAPRPDFVLNFPVTGERPSSWPGTISDAAPPGNTPHGPWPITGSG